MEKLRRDYRVHAVGEVFRVRAVKTPVATATTVTTLRISSFSLTAQQWRQTTSTTKARCKQPTHRTTFRSSARLATLHEGSYI